MAKKVRFRLWFHKLNIKRFSNPSQPVLKRRNSGLSLPPLNTPPRFSAPSSPSSFQSRHCPSSPDHISVSLLSSPCHSLPVAFSSPCHFTSLPTSFCSPRHSLPATSLSRHSRNKTSRLSKLPVNFSSAVLLSPINCKALDIAFPSGGSSPAGYTLLQSPTLQATSAATSSTVNVFSPPICKPDTVLFKSPLHPLVHQTSVRKLTIEPKMVPVTTNGRDGKVCPGSQCSAAARGAVREESTHLINTAQQRAAHKKKSIHAPNSLHVKQSPFSVDCGCHPSFSSSFRKTKKTLQACGSCSGSNEPSIIPTQNNLSKEAPVQEQYMWGGVKGSRELKSFVGPNCCREDAPCPANLGMQCPAKKAYQHRKKKKRMEVAEISTTLESPKSLFKQQKLSPTTPIDQTTKKREIEPKIGMENTISDPPFSFCSSSTIRDGGASLMEACTLAWEKDFSSFTSEDTFFSSFERSRPSFSSNSSSECFDKKSIYSKPASNCTNVAPNAANVPTNHALAAIKRCTEDLNLSNSAQSSVDSACPRKDAKGSVLSQPSVDRYASDELQHTLKSKGCIRERDPLVEVSFNAADHVCGGFFSTEAASPCEQKPLRFLMPGHGTRRSTLSPLVKIKEDSCEDGSTDTMPAALNRAQWSSSEKSESSLVKDLDLPEKLSLNPDYTTSCHADYYASVRANLPKSTRGRKKSTELRKSKGGCNMSNARIRRREHIHARWRLSNERIEWQPSAGEDEEVNDNVGCAAALTSQLGNVHMPKTRNRPGRRRTQDIKQQVSEPIDASSKAVSNLPLQTSASRAHAVRATAADDSMTKACEAERTVTLMEDQSLRVAKQSNSIASNPRLADSVAVVKSSRDPLVDFRESMVDMIIERQIYSASDLRELLQCFLSLNAREHHGFIMQAFEQAWSKLFHQGIGSQ